MGEQIRPITPEQVAKEKVLLFPDAVFEAFNESIVKNYDGHSATVMQKEVVLGMVHRGLRKKQIEDNHWLDVEDSYREAGWKVQYDGPAYNETYEPYYLFTPSKRRNPDR